MVLNSDAAATVVMPTTPSASRVSSPRTPSSGRQQGRFTPGAVLGGRYRIVAMLGRGGMGEVYRADDLLLEQQVALKFLPEAVAQHPEALSRFRNEVRLARQVSHRNVCRVYDFGEADGYCFLSMEYVDGEDLGSLLHRIGRLPSDKALEISRKVCAGLAAAHEKGILHRDLKPGNVMLDREGQVILTDFGLAGIAGEIEGDEVRHGTPAYMAPEQLAGEEVSVQSDIYSLGLVLYEIFTGKLPFESKTLADLVQAQKTSAPVSPSTLVRDLDPVIERVILRCLQPRPNQRPQSAMAVAAALPGGDPLAQALAAGETPSPEMVAAAGEGEGLAPRTAVLVLAAIVVGIAASYAMGHSGSAVEMLQPEYSPEVLTQKARDLIRQLGFTDVRADEASGFDWDSGALDYLSGNAKSLSNWREILAQKPGVLQFWYRQAATPMIGVMFHDDLLTPGLVQRNDDPPFEEPGMIKLVLDERARLVDFERVPEQLLSPAKGTPPSPDWNAFFAAANLDISKFQPAEPLWTAASASDFRTAWTTSQPRERRVEAAALRGRPLLFRVIEPWTKPEREPSSTSTKDAVTLIVISLVTIVVGVGGVTLARKNLAQGRGDRRGAVRLAVFFGIVQIALWLVRAHFTTSIGTFAIFLIAMCTAIFYAVVIWTLYLGLEPYVRRRWPRTIISWSSVLTGRWRDPVVGRDTLIGMALAASLLVLDHLFGLWFRRSADWSPGEDATAGLEGLRHAIGLPLSQLPHGIRETIFFLFIILLFRALLRHDWLAGAAFALLFSVWDFFGGSHPLLSGMRSFLNLAGLAYVGLRWGMLSLAVGIAVANGVGNLPSTTSPSEWYFGSTMLVLAIVAAVAVWAFRTAIGGKRLLKGDWLG